MGATKLPRCVYDRSRHSHLPVQVASVAKFIIGNAAEAIDVPTRRTEKTKSNAPQSGLLLQCCHRITESVFDPGRRLTRQEIAWLAGVSGWQVGEANTGVLVRPDTRGQEAQRTTGVPGRNVSAGPQKPCRLRSLDVATPG